MVTDVNVMPLCTCRMSGPLSVEEDVGNITFVKRSQPAVGNASVTFISVTGTALVIPGMGIFDYQPV